MAINLWKIGGQPTSYNPLIGNGTNVSLPLGDFVVLIKAKSISGARIRVVNQTGSSSSYITLTPEIKNYIVSHSTIGQALPKCFIQDTDSRGDIIIQDIQLVQKPLPKLTINGMSDNPDDWEQGTITGTGLNSSITTSLRMKSRIPIEGGKTYSFKHDKTFTGAIVAHFWDGNNSYINYSAIQSNDTFTAPSNARWFTLRFTKINASEEIIPSEITKAQFMFNLGATPAPYSKKTGDKMVLPTPKGNLFDGILASGAYNGTNGLEIVWAGAVRTNNKVPVKPNTTYTVTVKNQTGGRVHFYTSPTQWISMHATDFNGQKSFSFTTPSNCYFVGLTFNGTDTNDQIMLNEGTIPQPYTPYAVQVNKKPKRYVPKKNLLPSFESGSILSASVGNDMTLTSVIASRYRSPIFTCKPSTPYVVRCSNDYQLLVVSGGVNKIISTSVGFSSNNEAKITTGASDVFMRVIVRRVDGGAMTDSDVQAAQVQCEEGTTATPYEPFQLVLPKAKSGLVFRGNEWIDFGTSNDFALTNNFEIEFTFYPTVQRNEYVMCKGANNWAVTYGYTGGMTSIRLYSVSSFIEGSAVVIPSLNSFYKIKYVYDGTILSAYLNDKLVSSMVSNINFPISTSNFYIGRSNALLDHVIGVYKNVKIVNNGKVVIDYDFENPQNIVGDKVIPNAKNLIPSFEDSRWSLHANADVLGKDVLRLEASGNDQASKFVSDVKPNTTYLVKGDGSSTGRIRVGINDGTIIVNGTSWGTSIVSVNGGSQTTFTTGSSTTSVTVLLTQTSPGTGTFDFIKPQLYELSGKEGTIVGKPLPLRKAAKRLLYAKR